MFQTFDLRLHAIHDCNDIMEAFALPKTKGDDRMLEFYWPNGRRSFITVSRKEGKRLRGLIGKVFPAYFDEDEQLNIDGIKPI